MGIKPISDVQDKPKDSRIIFVIDRSGSMSRIKTDTEGGFTTFVEEQKADGGNVSLTLVEFNTDVDIRYENQPINDVKPYVMCPQGSTALYDAIGTAISQYRGNTDVKTILVIMTDGEENASREYDHFLAKKLITEVQEKEDWNVIFLGANIDVAAYASNLGINGACAAAFSYDSIGATKSMMSISKAVSSSRGISKTYDDGTLINAQNFDLGRLYRES